jgi:hypothetical protein
MQVPLLLASGFRGFTPTRNPHYLAHRVPCTV